MISNMNIKDIKQLNLTSSMKRMIAIFLSLVIVSGVVLALQVPIHARPAITVTNLSASYRPESDELVVTGDATGADAVAVVLINSQNNTLLFTTVDVTDDSFSYNTASTADPGPRITLNLPDGTYTIKAADYAGGPWTSTSITVVNPVTQESGRIESTTLGAVSSSLGIYTNDLSSLVAVPEQWESTTTKVEYFLNASEVNAKTANFAFISNASGALKGVGATLLKSFNIDLMKRVTRQDGTVTESAVDNQYIRGNITVRIPIDATLAKYTDLSIVYIEETGNLAYLTTKRVMINGIEYLEFDNNHFSVYGIATGAPIGASKLDSGLVPATGEEDTTLTGFILLLIASLLSVQVLQNKLKTRHRC